MIPYTSTFISLFRLYQECHVHCIVLTNNEGDGIGGGRGDSRETGAGYHLIVFDFFLRLCILLSQALSLYLGA